ncbi:PAS domain-containing protein [Polaromonas sp.]|uniref:PAS domain-containing protein n=1 Tax=Polaromonas sp. TaxID=1869339 RepID=UPI00375044DC
MTPLSPDLLFEHTSDAIVVLDAGLHIRRLNHRASMLYRQSAAPLIGRRLLEVFPDVTGSSAVSELEATRAGKLPRKFDMFIPGLFAWHTVLAVPHDDMLVLFIRDITDRVRREQDEAVRSAVRSIVENLPVLVTITRGPNHRIELVNAMARTLVGREDMEGELLHKVVPEASSQGFIDRLDAVYASGQRFEGRELPLDWLPPGADAPRRSYFHLVYQPLRAPSGEINGILHLGVEETDQVHKREVMARYAAERVAILEQLSEGVIVTDAAGEITFVNEAAKRLHGVALLGVAPEGYTEAYNLLTEDGAPYPVEDLPLSRAVHTNQPVLGARWRIRRPDQTEVLVSGNAKPVLGSHGERVACVLTLNIVGPEASKP